MFSLNKLLLLLLLLVVVIVGFRVAGQLRRQRREIERLRERPPTPRKAERPTAASPAEEMRRCTVCGAFVAGDGACGRADCPFV